MSAALPASRGSRKLLFLAMAAMASLPVAPLAQASSHREAPFIATQPQLDGTDLYMFRSYQSGRDQYVTLVANYFPFQDPPGAPIFFPLDPNAIYEIHVVNDGGAVENLTFQFRFQNTLDDNAFTVGDKQTSIPLIQNGSVDVNTPNSPGLNRHEKYTIGIIRGASRGATAQPITNLTQGGTSFDKPVDNIGQKTISNYIAYANKHIYDTSIPGCSAPGRVFVGQRKDPFVVNIGEIGDLVNIKYPATELNPLAEFASADNLAKKNVTSIIMEVPIACLTEGKGTIIGAWTTSAAPATRTLTPTPGPGLATTSSQTGTFVQVSRLGMPLVNEVVIGLKDKDRFNGSEPKDDAQFANYVTNPSLPALLEKLFGSAGVKAPTNFPRTDLVAAFLTGIPGLNKPTTGGATAEMMRLNTAIAPVPMGSQNRLGVLGGDNAGFPNGRRPGDDVVDIELRVAMGVLCTIPTVNTAVGCKPSDAPAGTLHYTDGAYISDMFFANEFPYLRAPLKGSPNDDDALKLKVTR
ncbi:MAG: DUF4331 domain-containing protein [Pseudomonadota bacterium]|nr:DUF4331 domain-containing protein [Pseudomonadota bacterium]